MAYLHRGEDAVIGVSWGGVLLVQRQGGLGAGPDGVPDLVDLVCRRMGLQDLEVVVVVQLEHIWCEADTDAVGLAHQVIYFYFHRRLLKVSRRRVCGGPTTRREPCPRGTRGASPPSAPRTGRSFPRPGDSSCA